MTVAMVAGLPQFTAARAGVACPRGGQTGVRDRGSATHKGEAAFVAKTTQVNYTSATHKGEAAFVAKTTQVNYTKQGLQRK